MGLVIIGRTDGEMSRGSIIFVAEQKDPFLPEKLLNPHSAQSLDFHEMSERLRSLLRSDVGEQARAILANLMHPLLLSLLAFWKSPFFDPACRALKPLHGNPLLEPLRIFL